MSSDRFELLSYSYRDMRVSIYDHMKKQELDLSLYEIIDLLNAVSQKEYDLVKLKKDIDCAFDKMRI